MTDPTIQQQLLDYRPAPDSLAGQVILITGASQGIGHSVARACAAAGARTLLLGRDLRRLEALANAIETDQHPTPSIVPMNLEGASVDDYAQLASLISEQYGRLDGLVLNAGMLGELAPIAGYEPATWARVFQVNVHSPFLLTQACLPLLRAGGNASVVFTSSSVGRRGRAYWGAYAASKFAIEGLMQTLADEVANDVPRLRVNSLNPGRVRTRMRAQAYPAENPASLVPPEAIVSAYLFLLSAHSNHVHGTSLDAQPALDTGK